MENFVTGHILFILAFFASPLYILIDQLTSLSRQHGYSRLLLPPPSPLFIHFTNFEIYSFQTLRTALLHIKPAAFAFISPRSPTV
jgi:hypothetical protein